MLRENDGRQRALAHLYRAARDHVVRMVLKYGGREDEALEVLSEGMLIFLRNIDEGKFKGASQLKVYLVGICKYLWRDVRKRAALAKTVPMEAHLEPVLKESVAEHLDRMDTVALVRSCLDQLTEACQELFRWRFFEGEPAPWEVIAERLGYDNAQVARNKGQRCMKSLKSIFFRDRANADRQ